MNPERAIRFGRWRNAIGIVLLAAGIIALVTPFTPGAWLIFVGAQMLGFELIYWQRLGESLERRFTSFRKAHIYLLLTGAAIFAAVMVALGWMGYHLIRS